MRQELQNNLFEKYPKIFRQKDLPMSQTCMCWGIETGDGWYDLLDKLCSFLQFHTDHNKYPQIEATQVKEKYGSLRFYADIIPTEGYKKSLETNWPRHHEYLTGAIDFAESMSHNICEDCGLPGEINKEGHWKTCLCDKCRNPVQENDGSDY